MWLEAFSEEFVGNDPGLRESVHAFSDLHVEVAMVDFGSQVVCLHEIFWDKAGWYSHIFISVHRCFQVEILNVGAAVFGTRRGKDTVPKDFAGDHIGSPSGDFARVSYQIAANGDADSVGVGFLGSVVGDDPGIGYCAVGGYVLDLVMREVEHCIGTLSDVG